MFHLHQLELFYYVARHGGISAAARHIPHGIGQPAISGQMAAMESDLGSRLFERRPFRLTHHGQLVYAYIRPMFDGLPQLWRQLRGLPTHTVSIAAAETLGHDLLAAIIDAAGPLPQGTRLELLTGRPDEIESWVQERKVQFAITPNDRRIRRISSQVIARLGLQLLVPPKAPILSPVHFWGQRTIAEPLICPPEDDPVYRAFARGLKGLQVDWPARIHVDSPSTLRQLVSRGQGVGLSLELPSPHPAARALPLTGFDRVPLVMLWRPPVSPLLKSLLTAVKTTAKMIWPVSSIQVAILLTGQWLSDTSDLITAIGATPWE